MAQEFFSGEDELDDELKFPGLPERQYTPESHPTSPQKVPQGQPPLPPLAGSPNNQPSQKTSPTGGICFEFSMVLCTDSIDL